MRDGISIPNSVQTLITKANTSLSPFKHHSLGNRQQQQNDSSSNGHHHHFAKGCKSTCSSSKNENSQCPSTPSRRPPPPVHRKTSIARRKNFLLSLQKPSQLEDLVRDFNFLHEFFSYFSSKERTVLAQVCLSPSESPPLSMQLANCPKCVLCLLVSAVMSLRHAQALHLFLEFKEFYSCFSSHESFQFSIYRRVNFFRLPWSSLLRETTQVERHARQRWDCDSGRRCSLKRSSWVERNPGVFITSFKLSKSSLSSSRKWFTCFLVSSTDKLVHYTIHSWNVHSSFDALFLSFFFEIRENIIFFATGLTIEFLKLLEAFLIPWRDPYFRLLYFSEYFLLWVPCWPFCLTLGIVPSDKDSSKINLWFFSGVLRSSTELKSSLRYPLNAFLSSTNLLENVSNWKLFHNRIPLTRITRELSLETSCLRLHFLQIDVISWK